MNNTDTHLTVDKIQNIQKHLENLSWEDGEDWSYATLKLLFDYDEEYISSDSRETLAKIVDEDFGGNLFKFIKWIDKNTVKSQKVDIKSKMLVVGSTSHDIGIDETPNEVDYRKHIDIDKLEVDYGWDWGIQKLSSTKQISLKPHLVEV